jgi:hypothetical protein
MSAKHANQTKKKATQDLEIFLKGEFAFQFWNSVLVMSSSFQMPANTAEFILFRL